MKTILIENPEKITEKKWQLEKVLKIKILLKEKEVNIEGNPVDEFVAEKILEAIDLGFPMRYALMIKENDFFFGTINIKDYTKRNDLETIRARIIGTKGKTLQTLSNLTGCHLEIKENKIGIIGPPENIEKTTTALASLIRGSKQANVYAYLEHHQPEDIPDLGLKEKNKSQ